VCPGSDALATLQRHVCAALKDGGLEVADERFNAHLTIGRVRDEAGADVRAEIGRRWATTAVPRLPLYDVHEFHLMRSDLSPSGPRYTSLAAMPLLGSARA
jgi:2'-5' RNA ligase